MEVAAGDENGGLAQGKNPSKEKDDLESTRAEISEIKQENEKLRTSLAEMMKVYRSLQSQFSGDDNKQWNTTTTALDLQEGEGKGEELDLKMRLSLGASGGYRRRKKEEDDDKLGEGDLELDLSHGCGEQKKGLNMKNDSSVEELREEDEVEEKEGWISRKILKKTRYGKGEEDDLIYNPVKKARVSIRARCDGIMMNDGCQWRKYGQKIAKANPCPRSYYRCTIAQGCPVRKQVQRCADDMSILTTTYEGKHNHALPPAATAVATTTSAAVDMLLSGSSNSKLGSTSMAPMIMDCSSINGMNFNVAGTNSRSNRPVFLSISQSHPTITLDLTLPESSSSSSSSSNFTQLGRLSTTYKSSGPRYQPLQTEGLRYHPTTTTFSYPSLDSTINISGYNNLSYNGRTDHHHRLYGNNKNPFLSLNFGVQQKLEQKFLIQSDLRKITSTTSPLTDTITEATKAIATDPSFQSALAATVATVLGGNGRRSIQESRGGGGGDMLTLGLNREEEQQQQHLSSVLPSHSSSSSSSTWMGRLMSHRDANWE